MSYGRNPLKCVTDSKNISPRKGDIWWTTRLAFSNGIDGKERPVLILQDYGSEVECYRCTTQTSNFRRRYEINDLLEAGLDKTTYIDMEVRRLPKTKLSRRIGRLSKEDCRNLHLN